MILKPENPMPPLIDRVPEHLSSVLEADPFAVARKRQLPDAPSPPARVQSAASNTDAIPPHSLIGTEASAPEWFWPLDVPEAYGCVAHEVPSLSSGHVSPASARLLEPSSK